MAYGIFEQAHSCLTKVIDLVDLTLWTGHGLKDNPLIVNVTYIIRLSTLNVYRGCLCFF